MAGKCILTLLSSMQADRVTDMFVSGLLHKALVQFTDLLSFFVNNRLRGKIISAVLSFVNTKVCVKQSNAN